MFMVLTDVPTKENVSVIEKQFGIQISYVEDFEQRFQSLLNKDIFEPQQQ